jgi:hypothetical protein
MTGETSAKSTCPATQALPAAACPPFLRLPTELQFKIWLATLPPPRIVEISYSPARKVYISKSSPPLALSICNASRQVAESQYQHLELGDSPLPIPFDFANDKLYVSSLAPIISTHGLEFLYDLAVCPSRHVLRSVFLDLRFFNELCDSGLLVVVAGMNRLDELGLVVEYGRAFRGEAHFVDVPGTRSDLIWVAKRVAGGLNEARKRVDSKRGGKERWKGNEEDQVSDAIRIRCVFLTRGGNLV